MQQHIRDAHFHINNFRKSECKYQFVVTVGSHSSIQLLMPIKFYSMPCPPNTGTSKYNEGNTGMFIPLGHEDRGFTRRKTPKVTKPTLISKKIKQVVRIELTQSWLANLTLVHRIVPPILKILGPAAIQSRCGLLLAPIHYLEFVCLQILLNIWIF